MASGKSGLGKKNQRRPKWQKGVQAKTEVSQPKQKTRYANRKLVGLDKTYFSKVKQEFHDIDYTKDLNEKEKKFMSTFMEESLGANLNHPGKKLHKSKAMRKSVFDANNARQRDIYALGRARGGWMELDPVNEQIEAMQQEMYHHDSDAPELTENQEVELLTKREFLNLIKNGAIVPDSMITFYKKLYKLI